LLEFLKTRKQRASSRSLNSEEQMQEAAIDHAIAALNIRISEESARPQRTDAKIDAMERDLTAKRLERSVFLRRLYETHPDLAMARGDLPAASVADIRRTIPADGAILEYVCLPERSWVVVLTRDSPLRIYAIHADRDELHRLIAELNAELSAQGPDFRTKVRKLYDLLIAPAETVVRTKRILCIVPDVPMGNLPFQALIDTQGKYLIERSAVFYAPSAAFLVWRANHESAPLNDGAQLLAFGNPLISSETGRTAHARTRGEPLAPLPEAEQEVRALAQMYGARATIRVGAEATEAEFKKDAPHFRLLHLATHGMYDDSDPMYSHLVLARRVGDSEDGLLEAREVADLDLHADLAVLSACETGRGGERAGEGMIGLSWALLAAGCDTAILTEFKVDSASSRDLMIAFHRRLLQQGGNRMSGRAAVEALRDAELAMLKSRRSNPYYWASFFAAGGW
jgi:CHAT domain-containing protein